jgi:uncharacterized protein
MSAVEATLWTIGSVVALVWVHSTLTGKWPWLTRDRGAAAGMQAVVYLALLWLVRFVYFPVTRPGVVLGTRPARWVYYPLAVLLGVAIQFPATGLYEAILARWPAPAMASDFAEAFATLPTWRKVTAGIGLLVTTPLVEEAFFRGALFGTLRRRNGPVSVVIMTSVLFALIHMQPQGYLPIAMVGGALAFLRIASGSMWPGVVGHMAFNGVTFYAIAGGAAESAEASAPTPVLDVVIGTVVTAGLLALADFFRSRERRPGEAVPEEPS